MVGSAPDRVLAILEADGGWMTLDQIEADWVLRWGYPPKRETLTRALYRVVHANTVVTRIEEHADYDGAQSERVWSAYGSPLGFSITRHVAARLV